LLGGRGLCGWTLLDCCRPGGAGYQRRDVGLAGPLEQIAPAEVAVVGDFLEVAVGGGDLGDELLVVRGQLHDWSPLHFNFQFVKRAQLVARTDHRRADGRWHVPSVYTGGGRGARAQI
jgi:hypothetical protein